MYFKVFLNLFSFLQPTYKIKLTFSKIWQCRSNITAQLNMLLVVCFVLAFYSSTRSIKRTFLSSKIPVFAFSMTLLRPFVYVNSHTCFSLMLVVCDLFERSSMYLLMSVCVVCIVYTLFLVVLNLLHTRRLCLCSFCILFSFERYYVASRNNI